MRPVVVGAWIAGSPVRQVQLGVIGAGQPHRATAVLPRFRIAVGGRIWWTRLPGFVPGLAWTGNRVEAPDFLSRVCIQRRDEAPNALVASGRPNQHHVLDRQWSQGERIGQLHVSHLGHPELRPTRRVDGDDVRVERAHEHLVANHRDAAVVRAAARQGVGGCRVDEETEWEGLFTVDYHLNRFTSFLAGIDVLGEGTATEETRGILGVRYLFPLNLESTSWFDTDGGGRFSLAKELELSPRFGIHGEVEYDTHTQWEGKVGLTYLFSKDISMLGNWHSEFGWGVGLQIRF